MKSPRIPTIIAVIILMFAVAAGVFLVQNNQVFRIGASPDMAPQDVRISNISDSSFSVSWTTDKATVGSLKWGESVSQVTNSQPSADVSAQNVHYISLNNLTAGKTYYFVINSDGTDYDNSGIPWQTNTGSVLGTGNQAKLISGTVMTATGQPATQAVVYITGSGISPLAAKTTTNGSWVIQLGQARNSDLTQFIDFATKQNLQVYVQGGASGIASAQATSALTTVPTMVLGQNYDFTTQEQLDDDGVPNVNLNLPSDTTPSSKFNLPDGSASPAPKKEVTLESIEPNETVNTTKPEVLGEGPAGTKITITIQSDPITGTTTVAADGTWKWNPPTDLPPGEHTITVSWQDAKGILQTLTRSFVVQAAEGPAFVATPSATPRVILASASPSARPSTTPRVSIPSTESGIPRTGSVEPTIILAILGISFITTSIYVTIKYAGQ